ncbi:hypothetical protein ACFL48_02765 [Pseudomonadota bacterium]
MSQYCSTDNEIEQFYALSMIASDESVAAEVVEKLVEKENHNDTTG